MPGGTLGFMKLIRIEVLQQLVQKICVVYVYISYYLILMLFRLVQWAHGKINNDHTDYFKGKLGLRSPREKKLKIGLQKVTKWKKMYFGKMISL